MSGLFRGILIGLFVAFLTAFTFGVHARLRGKPHPPIARHAALLAALVIMNRPWTW